MTFLFRLPPCAANSGLMGPVLAGAARALARPPRVRPSLRQFGQHLAKRLAGGLQVVARALCAAADFLHLQLKRLDPFGLRQGYSHHPAHKLFSLVLHDFLGAGFLAGSAGQQVAGGRARVADVRGICPS